MVFQQTEFQMTPLQVTRLKMVLSKECERYNVLANQGAAGAATMLEEMQAISDVLFKVLKVSRNGGCPVIRVV